LAPAKAAPAFFLNLTLALSLEPVVKLYPLYEGKAGEEVYVEAFRA
jgi:hypothetical protein